MDESITLNLAKIAKVGVEEYMSAVKRCKHRGNGKCGNSRYCNVCEHKATVEHLYESFKEAPASNGVLTEGWQHFPPGSSLKDVMHYLGQFETNLSN